MQERWHREAVQDEEDSVASWERPTPALRKEKGEEEEYRKEKPKEDDFDRVVTLWQSVLQSDDDKGEADLDDPRERPRKTRRMKKHEDVN